MGFDADASATTSKPNGLLRSLPATLFPVELDGVAGVLSQNRTLHVFGHDLADRTFKRISIVPDGGLTQQTLRKISSLDHPILPQRCNGKIQVLKSFPGPGNRWQLLTLDPQLARHGAQPIPTPSGFGFLIPLLRCDGRNTWIIWNLSNETRVQLRRTGEKTVTHRLPPRRGGSRSHVSPQLRVEAWKNRLCLLRSSTQGIEAILVGATGELRRSLLSAKGSLHLAMTRVGQRLLVVWVRSGRKRTRFMGRTSQIVGRWLDKNLRPLGNTQVFAKRTETGNVQLHLWSNANNQLVMGRTVRIPRRLRGGGHRYHITSHITRYDVARRPRGAWLAVGESAISHGKWIGDTLFLVMGSQLTRPKRIHVHVRRFRF